MLHSHFQTPRRRNHPVAYSPHRFLDRQGNESDDDREEVGGDWQSLRSSPLRQPGG
uniref:Uncharacterized protein n=1 Tax=Arundo donax TaxID=35708 RepID=A0A0A8XU48_ARUDO